MAGRLEWEELVVPLTRSEIMTAVGDSDWQALRIQLAGMPLEWRYKQLRRWLDGDINNSATPRRWRQVQVANYVNALKRGGMIK